MSGLNFFLVHKLINGKSWKPIYKSEITPVANNAYTWLPMSLLSSDMAGDDVDREIRIDFFNSQKSGKHRHRGQASFTLA